MSSTYKFRPTKRLLYQQTPKIIEWMRVPDLGTQGPATAQEMDGANDILFHLLSDESITAMSILLRRDPESIYDAINAVLFANIPEGATHAEIESIIKQRAGASPAHVQRGVGQTSHNQENQNGL